MSLIFANVAFKCRLCACGYTQNPTAHFRDKSARVIGYFQLFLINLKMLFYPCDLCHAHSMANIPVKVIMMVMMMHLSHVGSYRQTLFF